MIWTGLQKYSTTLATFVSDIILARLLSPYDFGCIEMLAIFMLMSETFVNGGFASALIQKKQPTQIDYSTIFFWNLGMAGFVYFVLYLISPAISRFYNTPLLCPILRTQGVILFIYALNVIQTSILKKQFKFKIISIISIISAFVSLGITILLAYKGLGVWSLVAKNLIAGVLTAIISWLYLRWRPLLVFSWKSFKELFGFGFYIFLSELATSFSAKFQGLLIGKFFNPTTMGFYAKASGTEGVVSTSFSQIVEQVTYPLYAEVQDDLTAMQNMIKRLTMTLSYISFPVILTMMLVAKPLFLFLYTDKWLSSVPYFQLLCTAGLGQCLQSVNFQTISAIGRGKQVFIWTLVKRVAGIGAITAGMFLFGMKGILGGAIFNAWFTYFVNMGLASKYVGYKWYRQLLDLSPVFFSSILIAVIVYFSVSFLHLDLYLDGILKAVVYFSLYIGWSLLFKPEAYKYSLDLVVLIRERNKK